MIHYTITLGWGENTNLWILEHHFIGIYSLIGTQYELIMSQIIEIFAHTIRSKEDVLGEVGSSLGPKYNH